MLMADGTQSIGTLRAKKRKKDYTLISSLDIKSGKPNTVGVLMGSIVNPSVGGVGGVVVGIIAIGVLIIGVPLREMTYLRWTLPKSLSESFKDMQLKDNLSRKCGNKSGSSVWPTKWGEKTPEKLPDFPRHPCINPAQHPPKIQPGNKH
ncbi:hypothetical protein SERLA73DRAFT_149158 [Serpula lacrymans var. lacrymans S7.3]|uniref:Uncharacterized protein n=1 Tax=Serpula lacrymans var. lacrymans (strain S7.3) TaxID=936435 RepID=F8PFW9_SERL3|nr:hypothetical protein SERLA73DRAFT_149158 [Serpula lacrymans var. lacrymans S7.3]